jgi:hypothetical protein
VQAQHGLSTACRAQGSSQRSRFDRCKLKIAHSPVNIRATAAAAHYSFSTPPPDDGTPTHAPRHRACFTQTTVLLEPRNISYPIRHTHATASSSCTLARSRRRVHIKDLCLERPQEASRRCASERPQMVLRPDLDGSERPWLTPISMTSICHHDAPTGRRVSPPLPSSPSAPPTERSGHGAGSAVQATAAAASTVMRATARRQERLRSGRYGRSGSGRPSLRWAPSKCTPSIKVASWC